MKEEKKELFEFVFEHSDTKEIKISPLYSIYEILETNLDDIIENVVYDCDCNKFLGEGQYDEGCNCHDYFDKFTLKHIRQLTNQVNSNGEKLYIIL